MPFSQSQEVTRLAIWMIAGSPGRVSETAKAFSASCRSTLTQIVSIPEREEILALQLPVEEQSIRSVLARREGN